jgi:hypothetical protein
MLAAQHLDFADMTTRDGRQVVRVIDVVVPFRALQDLGKKFGVRSRM